MANDTIYRVTGDGSFRVTTDLANRIVATGPAPAPPPGPPAPNNPVQKQVPANPAIAVLADMSHWWGNDLQLSPTGDLARVTLDVRSRQRVLRRLLTSAGEYITHPKYGAGLPQYVGRNLDLAKLKANIRGQMFQEDSVLQAPPPSIGIVEIPNGVSANIAYTVGPQKLPTVLSFSLDR